MKRKHKRQSGFTLIEILIVVAIIAILSSVVLVGLGPTQQAGRDARRLSDLRETQTGLELYFSKCGFYPGTGNCAANSQPAVGAGGSEWTAMSSAITGSSVGVSTIPNDPKGGATYYYQSFGTGSSYTIGAVLENANNAVFTGYTAPANSPAGITSCSASSTYCIEL